MTKKIILGAAAALVLAPTAALAADLAVKAPPPVAIYDWTGFYIGGAAGGSIGTTDHIDAATGISDAAGFDITGWLAGGTIGYNWQVAIFVVGFEGDASWVSQTGRNADIGPNGLNFIAPSGNPAFTSTAKETWNATARIRAGYAVNNLLFYATGGYAAAGAEIGIKDTDTNVLLASVTSTHSGWTAGGGLEWWSSRRTGRPVRGTLHEI
jgi:outer membrane immunogenic protein